jgi:hypothetical protein
MKPAVIPKFSSESEEAAWWDAHRSEVEAEIRQRMKQIARQPDSQVSPKTHQSP